MNPPLNPLVSLRLIAALGRCSNEILAQRFFGIETVRIGRKLTGFQQILSETDLFYYFDNDRFRNVWNVSLLIECLK